MPEEFASIRDWVEPAHPGVVKLHEDLINIYTVIRDRYQPKLDQAFDRIARSIGFVVATTIPVDIEVGQKGQLGAVKFAAGLSGTLFEKELSAVLDPTPEPAFKVAAGSYHVYLIWYAALRLKLRTDWMEPAHLGRSILTGRLSATSRLKPEVMEPAHWFDASIVLPIEESILIHALDEVYPDLQLMTRIVAARQKVPQLAPEVREPAHLTIPNILAAAETPVTAVPRVEVREPAHLRPQAAERANEVLKQIADALRKAGF